MTNTICGKNKVIKYASVKKELLGQNCFCSTGFHTKDLGKLKYFICVEVARSKDWYLKGNIYMNY